MTCTVVLRNMISAPLVGLVQYSVCRSINRSTGGNGRRVRGDESERLQCDRASIYLFIYFQDFSSTV